jgi:hypothetical protein
MSYPDMVKTAADKVSRYTLAQCEYALRDCHATLDNWRDGETEYTRKVWCEVDALRDRIASLQRTLKLVS